MARIDDLYDEYVRAWHDGRAPDAETYLQRVPAGDEREGLADMIGTFVLVAPSVTPTPERAAELAQDPAFLLALALVDEPAPDAWGARLRAAREAAGISMTELGRRFAESFGLGGREERAAELLADLERDLLPASGVTERAARRLGELLGQAADALAPPRPTAGGALFRADPGTTSDLGWLLAEFSAAEAAGAQAAGAPPEGDAAQGDAADDEPSDDLDDLLLRGD